VGPLVALHKQSQAHTCVVMVKVPFVEEVVAHDLLV
jgi:hypothetical protein